MPAAELDDRAGVVVEIARDLVGECRRLTEQINGLEARLRRLVETLAPSLLNIPGCGVISAAVIIGETAGAALFKSKDAFAHFTGTAPFPCGRRTRSASASTGAGTVRSTMHCT
ncbi:transposase [Streptomyces murinus]|uniref:transposase n=1 Tax=Streptomyces murinus TaxID=33900 RepID=UPI003F47BC0D